MNDEELLKRIKELIKTTKGTARIMDENGLLEDLNLGIVDTYKFLTTEQKDDMYNYASTEISEKMYRESDGKLLCEANFLIACVDDDWKVARIPEELIKYFR